MAHTGSRERPASAAAPTTKRRVRVRFSLFFDGTLNNRRNTQFRVDTARRNRAEYQRVSGGDDSYEGEFSNVSRLEEQLEDSSPGYDYWLKVYTEGIGTQNLGRDEGFSYATGMDAPLVARSGIRQKVDRGLAQALTEFRRLGLRPAETAITDITVDTCGFSRGAAAARHCVYRIFHSLNSLRVPIVRMGFEVGPVTVRAVGLFDTVASHGAVYWNDTADLGLDDIRRAQHVLQLAAAEEYRGRFSLTNIASAAGRGRQVYLPGAHSDVGGGYRDDTPGPHEDWTRTPLVTGNRADDVGRFLLDRGWYERGTELGYTPQRGGEPVPYRDYTTPVIPARLTGRRQRISKAYSYIPLRLMADFFREQAMPVSDRLYRDHDPRGVPARARIEAYAARVRAGAIQSRPEHWEGPDPDLRALRHGFLHVSFRDEFAHQPNLVRPRGAALHRPSRPVYQG